MWRSYCWNTLLRYSLTAAWMTNFSGNFLKIIHYRPILQAKLSFLILWIDLKCVKNRYLLTGVELVHLCKNFYLLIADSRSSFKSSKVWTLRSAGKLRNCLFRHSPLLHIIVCHGLYQPKVDWPPEGPILL